MPEEILIKLQEAVKRDPEHFEEGWSGFMAEANRSRFMRHILKTGLKEGLFSDMAGALGAIHEKVVEAAKPKLIGREIIAVVPTTEALERFFKQELAKAYVVGETEPLEVPEKMATQDILCDIEIACKMEFSKSYIEDASWAVLARAAEEGARAIAQLETEKIIELYHAILAADLAGAAELATNEGSEFVWADVVSLWSEVEEENFDPDVLVLDTREMQGIMNANQFIQSLYFAPESAIRQGVYELPALGMKIVHSTLIPAVDATHNHKFAIDTKTAAVMLLRRDITTEPFENPGKLRSGIIISERIGLGVLRAAAVARGV